MRCTVYTIGTTAIYIFMVIFFSWGWYWLCCDSNILHFAQKISVTACTSDEICMCIDQCTSADFVRALISVRPLKFVCALVRMNMMYRVWFAGHAYYLLMMRSNFFIFFRFLESIALVLSFLVWKQTPPLQMYDTIFEPWKKNERTRRVWWK